HPFPTRRSSDLPRSICRSSPWSVAPSASRIVRRLSRSSPELLGDTRPSPCPVLSRRRVRLCSSSPSGGSSPCEAALPVSGLSQAQDHDSHLSCSNLHLHPNLNLWAFIIVCTNVIMCGDCPHVLKMTVDVESIHLVRER